MKVASLTIRTWSRRSLARRRTREHGPVSGLAQGRDGSSRTVRRTGSVVLDTGSCGTYHLRGVCSPCTALCALASVTPLLVRGGAQMRKFGFAGVLLALCCAQQGFADSIAVGDLEFNSFSPGLNSFTINNFTGSNNLGFFPVADNVTFDNVVLTATEADATVLTFDLGSIGPGTNTDAQVADSLLFTQVVFSGTLDPSTFNLTNGFSSTFAADPALSFTLLPSSGSYLVANVDLGTINAAPVPEPSTLSLLALILGILSLRAGRDITSSSRR
jgi:hypothetical protein